MKQVDLIIIACNTASCYIEELKCETTIPMFGMIDITAAEVLKNKNINNEDDACITHHKVGQAVRQTP